MVELAADEEGELLCVADDAAEVTVLLDVTDEAEDDTVDDEATALDVFGVDGIDGACDGISG